ncbi:phage tail sheath C-terminal domain-containing protein [Methylobacterium brachiatum]|uniref:phage tail sheath C-terminal domain-containing protein n=1 Tax=Methylobacterium brachiatum TaxID=269660 RepID=UPI0008E73E8A|nr:phage tail sheath C-terminal domain-containing protein [Methylobacterium brachiatum]SFJ67935.1 Mu-like prophage tail sheath protein gpL [Methylobacterium brachiatum]
MPTNGALSDIPANWKQPLFWLTVDGSQAGLSTQREPVLQVGQMLPQGVAAKNVPIAVGSPENAAALFGYGSMLHRMAIVHFRIAPYHELWMMALADPAAGVAATGAIAVTTAPTTAGTIPFYIAGQVVSVLANGSDTAGQLATKIAAAINAVSMLPVSAAVDGTNPAKVNLTCDWKGLTGNDIQLLDCFYGSIGGEVLPAGLVLAYTAMSGGTGSPDMTAAIPAIGDDEYDYVALPFTDSVSLALWEIEYGFTPSGRWGWARQLYGGIFSARRDTYANLMTFGPTRNSPNVSIMPVEPTAQAPIWEITAAYAAAAADALLNAPARPLHTLEFTGILPAQRQGRFNGNQRQALATAGLAMQGVAPSGDMMILREQTTYQVNQYGQSDDAYELVTTLFTLARLFRRMKSSVTSKFGRHQLANDDTAFADGLAIVTPSIVKSELLSEYNSAVFDGLAENFENFKNNLSVERDKNIPTRLNVVYPPDIANGLRTFAVLAQFRLQFGRA